MKSMIAFDSLSALVEHQRNTGGWMFVSDDRSRCLWFDWTNTMSVILMHWATRGVSGVLSSSSADFE